MRHGLLGLTIIALFSGTLISAGPAFAQAPENSSVATSAAPASRPFAISLGISKSQSLVDFKDGQRQESHSIEFMPSYKWSFGSSMVIFSFSEDARTPGSSDIDDIVMAHGFKGWDLNRVKLVPSVSFVLPQSKNSRINTNLETSVSGKLTVALQQKLLIPGFYFKGSLGLGRNFHRYETALSGAVLNQYSSSQGLATGYSFGIFSADLSFAHLNAWSYQGTMKESYEHSEELSLALGDHVGFTLGHTNGGSVFKDNGFTSNYTLVDENNSMVYARLGMQY